MGYNQATNQMKRIALIFTLVASLFMTSCSKDGMVANLMFNVTMAEYQIQSSNYTAVKVRYYVQNNSSHTLYYLKFRVTHPSGSITEHEIGSKSNSSQWNLGAYDGTYTNYYNCSIPHQDGNIISEILDYSYY